MIFDDYMILNESNIKRGNGMCLSVNSSKNRTYGSIAYFKVYNNEDPRSATKEVRLHFLDNGYEKHNDGKKLWIMNSKEKKTLMKLLKQPVMHNNRYYDTTWKALITDFNNNVSITDQLDINLPITDYSL